MKDGVEAPSTENWVEVKQWSDSVVNLQKLRRPSFAEWTLPSVHLDMRGVVEVNSPKMKRSSFVECTLPLIRFDRQGVNQTQVTKETTWPRWYPG
jgi:hypothetical protein